METRIYPSDPRPRAAQAECGQAYPKTKDDPMGQGPGPNVATLIVTKLRGLEAAKHEAHKNCQNYIAELEEKRQALLDFSHSLSTATLLRSAREVRNFLA